VTFGFRPRREFGGVRLSSGFGSISDSSSSGFAWTPSRLLPLCCPHRGRPSPQTQLLSRPLAPRDWRKRRNRRLRLGTDHKPRRDLPKSESLQREAHLRKRVVEPRHSISLMSRVAPFTLALLGVISGDASVEASSSKPTTLSAEIRSARACRCARQSPTRPWRRL
jgi:hypothetical protein